jgi:hypothetical protein
MDTPATSATTTAAMGDLELLMRSHRRVLQAAGRSPALIKTC